MLNAKMDCQDEVDDEDPGMSIQKVYSIMYSICRLKRSFFRLEHLNV